MSIKNKKVLIKALCISLAVALLISVFSGINVFAASFSGGSGTKNDPYLIKTAQDVDNIRNNLSAHYKLCATIDMSSIKNFEPIGTGIMDENKNNDKDTYNPFTGSFVCDMGADGLPRYAILNLNVYNSTGKDFGYAFGSPNYSGFGEKGIHYLAALFGITEGATLTNIVLLNAKVENTVPGQHGGVGGFDDVERGYTIVKNQVDSTATAGLVGFAFGTTITGCGVQGKIVSTSLNTAGLVGTARNGSSISNSWADCEISGQGYWSNAGFIGSVNLSNVQSCYAKGSISFKDNHVEAKNSAPTIPSGFIRTIGEGSMISDCYSEVITKGAGNSYSFSEEVKGTVSNCYTTGIKEGKTDISAGEEAPAIKNCWIVKKTGANQNNFKAGSETDINKAFASLNNWDTSGKLPTLKNAYYIKDYKIYKAGTERAGAGASSNSQGSSNTQQSTSNNTGSTTIIGGTTSGGTTGGTTSGSTTGGTTSSGTTGGTTGGTTSSGATGGTTSSGATGGTTDGAISNTASDGTTGDTITDGTTGDTTTDGTNEVITDSEGSAGEAITQTVTAEPTTGYFILFICLAALTVAISASSVITLLKAFKQKKLLSEGMDNSDDTEGEEDYE